MLLERVTSRSSKNIASTRRVYSHSALSVTVQLTDTDTNSASVSYLVTMTKSDLEEFLKLITDREQEIQKTLNQKTCTKCGAVLKSHWVKNGMCLGCKNPNSIVRGV